MKVTLNWLKQYVDFDWSADELAERLTMLGLEVEGIEKTGGEFEGIVVAQVLTCDPHPNADKLSVCRVADGKGERQIVCGAHNFKPGDKVPLILPGYSLPAKPGEKPFVIKVGRIRGIESHGMMCSPKELGLADEADGLLILRPDAKVGQPFAEYLGRERGDVVYDLEITPNRSDLNSVIGIAREISALTGNPLKLPQIPELPASDQKAEDLVSVRLDEPELCPRYTARVIQGVKVGPSPDWLRHALEKVGLRSINNVVDVTNYVMLETGQPLHAFDYHLIAQSPQGKPTIIVRRASATEKFITLDGQERVLNSEMLLIADEAKGIALAGVMGGQNSEIMLDTRDVLLESAYFKPTNIRRTAKALGLRTDASYRFERGADIGITEWASRRAAQLILEVAGGRLAQGVVDAFPQPPQPRSITLRPERLTRLLGVDIPREQILNSLVRLGLKAAPSPVEASPGAPPAQLCFRIPTWRVDLKREVDLIEEVARLYGVERIPSTPPRGAYGLNPFDSIHDQISEARRILAGLGLDEAQGQTLIGRAENRTLSEEQIVLLANPLSSEMDALRGSLLPGLIHSLSHNVSHKNYNVALFEIGRVFSRAGGQLREQRRVAIAITGRRYQLFWSGAERDAKMDVFDIKGIVEEFLEQFGLRGVTFQKQGAPTALFIESAAIKLGGKLQLGEMGWLQPAIARKYDLRDPVLLAELDLDELIARRNPRKSFKPLPQFPAVRRDVALLVAEAVTHDDVLAAVRKAKPAHLEAVELFDVFRGQNVPAGHKSMAYAFTYRSQEGTLTDADVNAIHQKLVEQLKQTVPAIVRE